MIESFLYSDQVKRASKSFKIIDSYPDQREIIISHEKELLKILGELTKQKNRVILLESIDWGILTLGVGTPYGFVEYMNNQGSPPYLIAIDKSIDERTDTIIEFDSGGTITPIPVNKCLLIDRVVDIALYFFRNEELPNDIIWEEI